MTAPRGQSQRQIKNCAVLLKVPRSLLNGWKLLFIKGTCTNAFMALFKFISKQRVVNEELD